MKKAWTPYCTYIMHRITLLSGLQSNLSLSIFLISQYSLSISVLPIFICELELLQGPNISNTMFKEQILSVLLRCIFAAKGDRQVTFLRFCKDKDFHQFEFRFLGNKFIWWLFMGYLRNLCFSYILGALTTITLNQRIYTVKEKLGLKQVGKRQRYLDV